MLNVVVRHCGIGVGDHQVVWLGSWPPVARRWDFEFQPSMSWCDIECRGLYRNKRLLH